jgi:hypothetical protein
MEKKLISLVLAVVLVVYLMTLSSCGVLIQAVAAGVGGAVEDSAVNKRKEQAQSAASIDSLTTLNDKIFWLEKHAESGGSYIIDLLSVEYIDTHRLVYTDKTDITITLRGAKERNPAQIISDYDYGCFVVGSGTTMILEGSMTLGGTKRLSQSMSQIVVLEGGTFIMNGATTMNDFNRGEPGVMIMGNPASCGVDVFQGGTFIMNGGMIGSNAYSWGGGVIVKDGAIFIMNGGVISNNVASEAGGGVFLHPNATFTKTGGEIIGNSATYNRYSGNSVYAGAASIIGRGSSKRIEVPLGADMNVSYNKGITTGAGWVL